MQDQLTQTNGTNLQQPRSDLQPTTSALQQGGGVGGSSNALPQEQLTDKQLRVGDSATTVQNTTSAVPHKSQSTFPSVLVWLLVVLVGIVVALFFLMRRIKPVESIQTAPEDPEVGVPKQRTKPSQKKTKPTTKARSSAKRKHTR